MIYFDTDVLIHYLIEQDSEKSQQATQIFKYASQTGSFFCSLLCLQETAFVLAKLDVAPGDIEAMIDGLLSDRAVNYSVSQYRRAIELGREIGFKNLNDCLHTAIAETHCTELYTFNHKDFKRIQRYTKLKINIL